MSTILREELKRFVSGFGHADLMQFVTPGSVLKLIPPLGFKVLKNISFVITNDPLYIAGMGTFTTSFSSPHTFRPSYSFPQDFRGVIYFVNHPGVSVALLLGLSNSSIKYGVTRHQILASTLIFLTKTAILHTTIYPNDNYGEGFFNILTSIGIKPIDALPDHTPILGSFKVPPVQQGRFPKPHLDFISVKNHFEEDSKTLISELYTDYRDAAGKSLFTIPQEKWQPPERGRNNNNANI